MIYMRNKQTGEIKSVVPQSAEFNALKALVDGADRSLWEQTGAHHATAVIENAEAGALREQDLGKEDTLDTVVNDTMSRTEIAPWLNLTAAEIEAGLTPDKKQSEIDDMFSPGNRVATLGSAADKIAAGSAESPQVPGVTTVPPAEGAGDGEDNPGAHAELEGLTRDELKDKAVEEGADHPSNATKAEIATAIQQKRAEGASDETSGSTQSSDTEGTQATA